MKSHVQILALAVALSPAFAFAQIAPPAGSTPPTFPSGQQTGGDHDRDNQIPQQMPQPGDRDDQTRRGDRDRDATQISSATAMSIQNSIQQRLPNSNIAVSVGDNNSIVLTGSAATERDREYAERLARSQAPRVTIVNQITAANVQGGVAAPGVGGVAGTTNSRQSGSGVSDSTHGNVGSDVDRDRDRDRDQSSGTPAVDRDRNPDRDRSSGIADRARDRDDVNAQSDQDKDKDRDKDKGKHKGWSKKDKDKHKDKDKDKDKDDKDRDKGESERPQ